MSTLYYTYTNVNMHKHMHVYLHMHIHIDAKANKHSNIHKYLHTIHAHTYTHTCVVVLLWQYFWKFHIFGSRVFVMQLPSQCMVPWTVCYNLPYHYAECVNIYLYILYSFFVCNILPVFSIATSVAIVLFIQNLRYECLFLKCTYKASITYHSIRAF